MTKDEKILKYKSEELILILLICSTDLSDYDNEDLVVFTECIEGVIELLVTKSMLLKLEIYLELNEESKNKLVLLQKLLAKLYSPQWHKKLKEDSKERNEIRLIANSLLQELKISYIKPEIYLDTNLNIDW